MFCSNCGAKCDDSQNFCFACGNKLDSISEEMTNDMLAETKEEHKEQVLIAEDIAKNTEENIEEEIAESLQQVEKSIQEEKKSLKEKEKKHQKEKVKKEKTEKVKKDSKESSKKILKAVGTGFLILSAVSCVAGGFFMQPHFVEKEAIVRQSQSKHDQNSMTKALVYKYDNTYANGVLNVVGAQEKVIASISDAQPDKYVNALDCNRLIYMSQDENVWVYDIESGEKSKITDNGIVWNSIKVNDDATSMVAISNKDKNQYAYIYSLVTNDSKKIAEEYVYNISFEGEDCYCINSSNNLIKASVKQGTTTIAKNVKNYQILDDGSIFIVGEEGNNKKFAIYTDENTERLKFSDVSDVFADPYSDITFFIAQKAEGEEVAIYAHISNGGNCKVASNVESMQYSSVANRIYFKGNDAGLYYLNLPEYGGDEEKYQDALENLEENKIASDCESYMLSQDGKSMVFLENGGKLGYLYYTDEEEEIVAENVKTYSLFDYSLTYMNDEFVTFRAFFDDDAHDSIKTKSKEVVKNGAVINSAYGDYLCYVLDDTVTVLDATGESITIVPYIKDYDLVDFQKYILCDNTLSYDAIVGRYLLENQSILELTDDMRCVIYVNGKKENETKITVERSKNSVLSIKAEKDIKVDGKKVVSSNSAYQIQDGGERCWVVDDTKYRFMKLSSVEFDKVLSTQQNEVYQKWAEQQVNAFVEQRKKEIEEIRAAEAAAREAEAAEARRQAEAAAAAARAAEEAARRKAEAEAAEAARVAAAQRRTDMINTAKNVYNNGVLLLTVDTPLYSSAKYGTETGVIMVGNANYYALNYSITDTDINNGVYWIYIKYKWNNTTWRYGWVPVRY